MPIARSHDKLRAEPSRFDRLPDGLTARVTEPAPPLARDARGRFADPAEAGRRGARAKHGQTALTSQLGLSSALADPRFLPYRRAARNFARAHARELADAVNGGERLGAGPASVVRSAGLQIAASRYSFEVLGNVALGSKLANDARSSLLVAAELAAREAKARAWARPRHGVVESIRARAAAEPVDRGGSNKHSESISRSGGGEFIRAPKEGP